MGWRRQGLAESGPLNQTTQVKSVPGYVFSFSVAWKGLTAGDIVCHLIDDTADNGDPSRVILTVYADGATGNYWREWAQGKEFAYGILYKEGPTGSGSGAVLAEMTSR